MRNEPNIPIAGNAIVCAVVLLIVKVRTTEAPYETKPNAMPPAGATEAAATPLATTIVESVPVCSVALNEADAVGANASVKERDPPALRTCGRLGTLSTLKPEPATVRLAMLTEPAEPLTRNNVVAEGAPVSTLPRSSTFPTFAPVGVPTRKVNCPYSGAAMSNAARNSFIAASPECGKAASGC